MHGYQEFQVSEINFWVTLPVKPGKACQGDRWGWGNLQWRVERGRMNTSCSHETRKRDCILPSIFLLLDVAAGRKPRERGWRSRSGQHKKGTMSAMEMQSPCLPSRTQQTPVSSYCTFHKLPEHAWAQWGFWSQANPNRIHRTLPAGDLYPRTPHQPGQDFLRTAPCGLRPFLSDSFPLYCTEVRPVSQYEGSPPFLFLFHLSFPGAPGFQGPQSPGIKSHPLPRSILASPSFLGGPELTESSSNLHSSMCDDFTSLQTMWAPTTYLIPLDNRNIRINTGSCPQET